MMSRTFAHRRHDWRYGLERAIGRGLVLSTASDGNLVAEGLPDGQGYFRVHGPSGRGYIVHISDIVDYETAAV